MSSKDRVSGFRTGWSCHGVPEQTKSRDVLCTCTVPSGVKLLGVLFYNVTFASPDLHLSTKTDLVVPQKYSVQYDTLYYFFIRQLFEQSLLLVPTVGCLDKTDFIGILKNADMRISTLIMLHKNALFFVNLLSSLCKLNVTKNHFIKIVRLNFKALLTHYPKPETVQGVTYHRELYTCFHSTIALDMCFLHGLSFKVITNSGKYVLKQLQNLKLTNIGNVQMFKLRRVNDKSGLKICTCKRLTLTPT